MTNSVLSLMTPPGVVRKAHFWEWFSGGQIKSRWHFFDLAGTGTSGAVDAVNEGIFVTSDNVINTSSAIAFNDIRSFAHDGSVVISQSRVTSTAGHFHFGGLTESESPINDTYIAYVNDSTSTNYELITRLNSGTATIVDAGLAIDTSWHTHKLELRAASGLYSIDGALSGVSTTALPDVAMQPYYRQGTRTAATTRTGRFRYLEVYNT